MALDDFLTCSERLLKLYGARKYGSLRVSLRSRIDGRTRIYAAILEGTEYPIFSFTSADLLSSTASSQEEASLLNFLRRADEAQGFGDAGFQFSSVKGDKLLLEAHERFTRRFLL